MKERNGEFTDMTKFDEDLGRALRECREKQKKTQLEVADFCGVSKMTVSYWESGKHAMYAVHLKKYCQFLGVSVESIVERT